LIDPIESIIPRRQERLSGRQRSNTTIDPEFRSEFERDVDRVYYNYFFRRLSDITQVSTGHGTILRHNRMTHSIKVAQVGRRLTQYLLNDLKNATGIAVAGGIDHNVVTAAGLLHDTGHPPFGHIGEQQLNRLAKNKGLFDGFEGNAQTLRIILSLARHAPTDDDFDRGLDLTRAVVAACVKYPWDSGYFEAADKGKWGYYKPEEAQFQEFVLPSLPAEHKVCLEAAIMDWADDITYAVHDIQDYYLDGIITLHYLRHDQRGSDSYSPIHHRESEDFWQYATEKLRPANKTPSQDSRKVFEYYASRFPATPYRGTSVELARIGSLASAIITDASKATSVKADGSLYIRPDMRDFINVLKQITWYYVIDNPDLVSTQLGQRAQINQVFGKLYKRVEYSFKQSDESNRSLTSNEQWIRRRRLPARLRELTEALLTANAGQGAYERSRLCYARAVIDYIASMTEIEFVRLWRRLCPTADVDNNGFDDSDYYFGDEGA
jgi:dGTPase